MLSAIAWFHLRSEIYTNYCTNLQYNKIKTLPQRRYSYQNTFQYIGRIIDQAYFPYFRGEKI